MTRLLKIFLTACLAIVMLLMIIINVNVYRAPDFSVNGKKSLNVNLLKELAFLKESLDNGEDITMQDLYPEGYVFINTLYGLAWCNTIAKLDPKDSLYQHGHTEIETAFAKINSPTGRGPFDETLPLPYGAFYNGWSNYLLGQKLILERQIDRDTSEINQFRKTCAAISFQLKDKTYPASYYNGVWPTDVTICVASLRLHDKIFDAMYSKTISDWSNQIKSSVDKNGLIPHEINLRDGSIAEEARGSSQSLMLIFLKEIDPDFASDQFKRYEKLFIDTRLGLTGIREYPKGTFGIGDVDSGPVIFQMGGAATVVGMQTTGLFGKNEISSQINATIEGLAFPVTTKKDRFYLFGTLPMVDAFIAWAHSNQKSTVKISQSFLTFHLYSLTGTVLIGLLIWWLWRKPKPKSKLVVGW